MRILPAVDIRAGRCVNLIQGDYSQETVFSEDPVEQAREWRRQGGELIHIVDLDGAKEGCCRIEKELEVLAKEDIPFEVGGGVRSMETVDTLMALKASRVILGTAAFHDPPFLMRAVETYGPRIAVGIDARDGKVALRAWTEVTDADACEFARQMEDMGVSRIIYTDILHDGMMKGPNVAATQRIAERIGIPVTASGGVSSLSDIRSLSGLHDEGIDEVIVGRALYLKEFTLGEAIAAGQD